MSVCKEQGQYKLHLNYIKYIHIFQALVFADIFILFSMGAKILNDFEQMILPRQKCQYKYVIKASSLAKQSNLGILWLSFYFV